MISHTGFLCSNHFNFALIFSLNESKTQLQSAIETHHIHKLAIKRQSKIIMWLPFPIQWTYLKQHKNSHNKFLFKKLSFHVHHFHHKKRSFPLTFYKNTQMVHSAMSFVNANCCAPAHISSLPFHCFSCQGKWHQTATPCDQTTWSVIINASMQHLLPHHTLQLGRIIWSVQALECFWLFFKG